MNYTDQESCQIENCEDAFEPKGTQGQSFSILGRVARNRDRVEMDESIIKDNRSANKNNGQIFAIERDAEQTTGQLTRWKQHEKKTMLRHREKQYHRKELLDESNAKEPRLRIKSMHSKVTRKDQRRRVIPNRYLNGEGLDEMTHNTKVRN